MEAKLRDKFEISDLDAQQCYVFDRNTGRFLHQIGQRKNQGPQGYARSTSPLCVVGDEVLMVDRDWKSYKAFSLTDGKLVRKITNPDPKKNTWTFDKVYPLADSLLVQCPLNVEGKNGHRMTIQTLSGKSMKTFPSLNNAAVDISGFFIDIDEVHLYRYKDDVFFNECTSDTIFRINRSLELEPRYVIDLGDKLPTLSEIRNNEKMVKGKFVIFGKMMETDRWLLLSKSMWTEDRHYLYDKKNRKLGYMDGKDNRGFTNDLDGFLPFWPTFTASGQKEVCAAIQPEAYLEAMEITGKNPLGTELNPDDNPVIVIGSLK